MKKLSLTLLSFLLAFNLFAQNDTIITEEVVPVETIETIEIEENIEIETPDKTEISVGENEIFIIQENQDTLSIQLGSRGLSIVESEDGYKIDVVEMEKDEDEDEISQKEEKENAEPKKKKFKPHYAAIEFGLNNFLNPDNTLHKGTFMNLNTAESWNFNLNFLEYGFGFGSYAGLVTGMGIEWSQYLFDGNNSIQELDNGTVVERDLTTFNSVTESQFNTSYLTAPLLLEVQIPTGKHRVHVSAGLVGGVKLGSNTKIKYRDGGRQKEKIKDDFSLSPLRYGYTARIGYRALNFYANYYVTPLFGESPANDELHPFAVGLCLNFD